MSLERRGMREYYYRARWEDGRVVKHLVASGPLAELIAQAAAAERLEAQRRRRCELELDEQLDVAEEQLNQVDEFAAAALEAAGFHRPKRGRWRRRR